MMDNRQDSDKMAQRSPFVSEYSSCEAILLKTKIDMPVLDTDIDPAPAGLKSVLVWWFADCQSLQNKSIETKSLR